jgi:sugar/nucleoside kinase (ribokinase family)
MPADLPSSLQARAVLISGYLLLQDAGHEAAIAALERADAEWIGVEAASWPLVESFGAKRFFDETAAATVVLANDREAEALTGDRGERAATTLGERYRAAAVKRGAAGGVLVIDGQLLRQASETVDEIDPTGAGDAFDGVLLAGLARGLAPQEALARACRAGASVAASMSAWPERTR